MIRISSLEGKTILKAHKKNISKEYDDEPFLFLTMTDGSVFRITADYGGYTGKSEDGYPRCINIEKVKEAKA